MEIWIDSLLVWLALPRFGLSTVFVVAFVSATLLPLGSEPAVFGLVKLNPGLFWPAILVATAGNTLGGAFTWWMGYGAERAYERAYERVKRQRPPDARALRWLRRFGAKACLLSWLPIVGDPLCAVAGWLKLPFWPCVGYMAIGKLARYVTLTAAMLWLWPGPFTP
ncbi:MAG: YqaA family protein [Burkholderiaceae bacterium]